MIRNAEGATILSGVEIRALAMLIAARKLRDVEAWLDWEDVPNLDEDGCNWLMDAIRGEAAHLDMVLSDFEPCYDIDADELYAAVTL